MAILTAIDAHHVADAHAFARMQQAHLMRSGHYVATPKPEAQPSPAEINHSRWVFRCAGCNSSTYLFSRVPAAFCLGCGRQYRINWPSQADQQAGEAILLLRNFADMRNWQPATETVDALRAQNVAHGDPVPIVPVAPVPPGLGGTPSIIGTEG